MQIRALWASMCVLDSIAVVFTTPTFTVRLG
jgi:hypothetical protein